MKNTKTKIYSGLFLFGVAGLLSRTHGADSPAVGSAAWQKPVWVTDLALTYKFSKAWSASLNVNNLFDAYPTKIPQPFLSAYQSASYSNFGPVGAAGGFYSATVSYKF